MTDSHHTLEIEGRAVPLRVRRHARARKLILRIDDDTGGAVVTIPARVAVKDGVDMALRKSAWIAAQLSRRPARVVFCDGACVPFMGAFLTVRHVATGPGIRRDGNEVIVTGRSEHVSRRLTDWLKAQARAQLVPRVHDKAGRVAQHVSCISVRDTRSRWGSCGVGGRLNFSWRLIMAPEFVLDYVVAHEVAHLVRRDHGPDFWRLAESLCPHMDEAKIWLHEHGRALHRYG